VAFLQGYPAKKFAAAVYPRIAGNHGLLLTSQCEMKIVPLPPKGGILIFYGLVTALLTAPFIQWP
jgi:hypothetical protein